MLSCDIRYRNHAHHKNTGITVLATNNKLEAQIPQFPLAEITRDADETAIQCHSRSSVVVPIDTAYITFY